MLSRIVERCRPSTDGAAEGAVTGSDCKGLSRSTMGHSCVHQRRKNPNQVKSMSALRSAIALLAALATAPHDISPTSPHAWFASRPLAPSHPVIDSRLRASPGASERTRAHAPPAASPGSPAASRHRDGVHLAHHQAQQASHAQRARSPRHNLVLLALLLIFVRLRGGTGR